MANAITVVKKLSIKVLMGIEREADTKAFMAEKAKTSPDICAFAGDVIGYRTVVGQFGKTFALVGTFVGQNIETGECFEGGQLFLPKDAADNLVAQFEGRKEAEGYVNFSCTVKVVPDKGQGFMYITSPIRDARAITRKAELLASFATLPAPKAQIGTTKGKA